MRPRSTSPNSVMIIPPPEAKCARNNRVLRASGFEGGPALILAQQNDRSEGGGATIIHQRKEAG